MRYKDGFVFLNYNGIPYKCAKIGNKYWLMSFNADKYWSPVRIIRESEMWLYPHNLSDEEQKYYNDLHYNNCMEQNNK